MWPLAGAALLTAVVPAAWHWLQQQSHPALHVQELTAAYLATDAWFVVRLH